MKKTTSFSFLAILVFSILFSFVTPVLAGPASGTWVDFAHIEYDGETYVDEDPLDDNINFKLNGEQGSCVSEIKGFSTSNILDTAQMGRANFVLKEKDPLDTSSCNESAAQSITLNSTDKSNDLFVWVDQDRLQGASTGSIYVRLPGGDIFAEETNNSCKNSIELASNTTATFLDRAKNDVGECVVDKTFSNIGLGSSEENASKPPGTGTATGTSSSAGGPTCESEGGVFGWILCPLLGWASKAIELVEGWISNKLAVPSDYYDNSGVVGAWANMRNIAYFLLIPILLFMVISTALGYTFVDAYTVKRALPRLFVAIIFIALSYQVTTLLIDIVNIIGAGAAGLIAAPFGGSDSLTLQNIFNPNGIDAGLIVVGGGAVIAGLTIGAVTIVSVGVLGSYLLVAALALLSVFFLLILRQVIIIALIIVAPLAILSWIFPGNDKMWKIWWNSFSKLLLLYPIIVAAIVTGRAFALIVSESPATGTDTILTIIIVVTAYIAPFFLIPTLFRYAGGAFANIAGIVNNRSKGVFDRQRKYRGEKKKQNWQDTKSGVRFKGAGDKSFAGRANSRLQRMALTGQAVKSGGIRNLNSAAIDKEVRGVKSHELDELLKDQEVGVWGGNDAVTGIAGDVLNADQQNLTSAFARQYAKAPTKQAERIAQSAADSSGFEKGSTEYNDKYSSVLESEKAKFMPAITARASTAASRVVEMQNKGNFSGALSAALDESGAFTKADGSIDTSKRDVAISQVNSAQRKFGNTALARGMVIKAMEGGTYYENNEDTWRAAGLTAHGDDNAEADMVVKGRKALQGAGRIEGLGSFGTTLGHMQKAAKSLTSTDRAELKSEFASHLIDNNPASTLANQALKDKYLEADVIPELQRRIEVAAIDAEKGVPGAQDDLVRNMVIADGVHQMLGQTKPKMAKIWGDKLIGMKLPPTTVEVEQTVTVPVKKIVKTPTGLFDSNNEPIMTDKEVVVEEQQKVKVKKVVTRTVREANGELKNTPEWQKYHKELYTAEEYQKQELQRANYTPEERRAAQEEAERLGGGSGGLGGPPIGGPPIGGPELKG